MVETVRRVIIDPNDSDLIANVVQSESEPTKSGQVVLNPDGSNIGNPLDGYVLANLPVDTDTDSYFGYTKGTAWIIKKIATSDNSVRYATGVSGYTTNWTNRASLTYNLRA